MTVSYRGNGIYFGLAADVKPTSGVATNAIFITTDKPAIHYYNGSSWSTDVPSLSTAQTFTAVQTINAGTGYAMIIRRATSTPGLDVGISFNELDSGGGNTQYAAFLGGISSNTDGAEKGTIKFQCMSSGVLTTVVYIDGDGILKLGLNGRLLFSESGLTANRVFTYPDATAKLVGETTTQTMTNKTIGNTGLTITAVAAASIATPAAGFVNLFFDSDTSKLSIKDSAGTTTALH
jgi:hypothetical protein